MLSIQDLMLAQDVKRWVIVRTAKDQSLAEHTFNVVMIARAICKELGVRDDKVIKYALDHDLDEILTGDIPTPAKDRLGINTAYDGKSFEECNGEEKSIVALADIIEAMHFLNENQIGRHAQTVTTYLLERYQTRCNLLNATQPKLIKAANQVVTYLLDGEFECEKSE